MTFPDEVNALGQKIVYRDTRCLNVEGLQNTWAHFAGRREPYEIRHTEVKNVTPTEPDRGEFYIVKEGGYE